ncbi:unnamed protein product [Brassica rapa subsp. trilocularis]
MDIPFNIAHGSKDASFVRVVYLSHQAMTSERIRRIWTQPSLSHYHHSSPTRNLHQPGIEPGSVPWQGTILPLDHWCFDE